MLCLGEMAYILYRPLDLYMLWPFKATGTIQVVERIRNNNIFPSKESLPDYIVYNMPDGMWLLSVMLVMEAIWAEEECVSKKCFVWSMPVIIVVWEVLQYLGIASGTWDTGDILAYMTAIIVFITIKKIMKMSNKTKILVSLLTGIIFIIGAASCATSQEVTGNAVGVSARDGAENQVKDEVSENYQEEIYRNEVN